MKNKNFLTLKWGTLKSWCFDGNAPAKKLLEEYNKIGSRSSAILQKDTLRQKEIICKLIDLVPGKIYLHWDGKNVSKKEAKKYVMEYGKDDK